MKNFFRAAFVLPLLLLAVSCSEPNGDGGGNSGPIKLAPETELLQQVYADGQQGPAPIKFTADGPWTATVVAVPTEADGGSEVDWLKLSAYRGEAGEVSLTMELQPNLTGQDRKAEIRIACGETIVTITVEQKGTKADGTKPEDPDKPVDYALVESIEVKYCKEYYGGHNKKHYAFRYDDQNRIVEYEVHFFHDESELDYKSTTSFDYTVQGEIRTTFRYSDELGTDTYRILLDDQGRATQIFPDDGIGGSNEYDITHYAYNDEGRLSRFSWYDYGEDSEESYEVLTYQNSVISKVNYNHDRNGDGIYEKGEIVFPVDAFGDYPNDRLNIDPNWLLFLGWEEPEYMLPMLRLTGKGCDRLTLWHPHDDIDYDYDSPILSPGVGGYPEPNVTVHGTPFEYSVYEDSFRYQYAFNDDGTIATIVRPVESITMLCEYDIVVGNELYDPERPEMGYKYTIDETHRELKRSAADPHEWTFTYRQ